MLWANGEPERDEAKIALAKDIVLKGFSAEDLIVKKTAISMMKYLPQQEVYDQLLALFQDFTLENTTLNFREIKYVALESLFFLDPQRTEKELIAHNDQTLQLFDLYALFSIIGFDKITLFDNLFYFAMASYEQGEKHELFRTILYVQFFLYTREEKYEDFVRFGVPTSLIPTDYFFLHDYYKKHGLPLKKLIFFLQYKGGILTFPDPISLPQCGLYRSFTLDELLFQALLFRLDYTNTVYKKQFEITLGVDKKIISRDLSHYTFSPYFLVCDALAHFFAGVPQEKHFSIITSHFYQFENKLQDKIAYYIVHSPPNKWQTKAIDFLLNSEDAFIRKIALSSFEFKENQTIPEQLINLLDKEEDRGVRSAIFDLIGATKNKTYSAMLESYFTDIDPRMAILAAGYYLYMWE